jgi:octaprenyl-diphosphate synthase
MQQIRSVVARDFELVNQLIIEQLHSDVPLVENVGHYIVDAGGKRLRPLTVLLAAAASGYRGDQHVKLAAVIEFIHTATLLHDDVVDISSLRRGRPTANAQFGNAPSVLVGDFLYTRAFQLLVDIGDMTIMRNMADTTNMIAEGEVLQLVRAGDPDTTEQQYLDVITRKTAILFASACFGAASLAGLEAGARHALHEFGLALGTAFQIIDDVLDYEGDPATMGKNVGDDLGEGKPTLPLIRAMQEGSAAQRDCVRRAIQEKDSSDIEQVVAAVRNCGGLDYARAMAADYHRRALAHLGALPAGTYRDALAQVADLSINRDH